MKTIRLFASLRKIAGTKTIDVPLEANATVHDLINAISQVSPALYAQLVDEESQLSTAIQVMIDGRHIDWLNGLETVISDDADIALIPQVAGG